MKDKRKVSLEEATLFGSRDSLEEAYKLSIALNEYIADNRRYLDDIIKEREEIMSEMETEMDSNFGEEEL